MHLRFAKCRHSHEFYAAKEAPGSLVHGEVQNHKDNQNEGEADDEVRKQHAHQNHLAEKK
jgi:hypothetical protein